MFKSITPNLMVESVDETVEFYCGILGFSIMASVPESNGKLLFAILVKDSLSIMAQERKSLIEEYPVLSDCKVQPSGTLYITIDNFIEFYEQLRGKCNVLCDVHTTSYGAKEFAIRDNNGYVLTFAEKLGD